MTMPNFLIIGARKSGTSSLYHYLKQHPQVYLSSMKEPSFFAFEGKKPAFGDPWNAWALQDAITDIESYRALFAGVSDEIAIGEASTTYLTSWQAPERIRHYIPDAKLIAILRNPVERAYSDYLMLGLYDDATAQGSFAQMIRNRDHENREQLLQAGHYHAYLIRYYDIFDRSQIKIFLLQDLKADAPGMLRETFSFLGIDERFVPDLSIQHNVGGIPRNKPWATFFKLLPWVIPALRPFVPASLRHHIHAQVRRLGLIKHPSLEPEVRRELLQVYRDDILQLQDLIGRDLSAWLEL